MTYSMKKYLWSFENSKAALITLGTLITGIGSNVWAFDTTNKLYRWGTVQSIFDEEPDQGCRGARFR